AVVLRPDGKTLGLTPLSIEIAYSDSAVEFQFKKQGYEPKTMYVVPNLPSPLFATLRRADIEPAAVEGAGGSTGAPSPTPARSRRARAAAAAAAAQTQQQHPPKEDEDGVLEPSIR